MLLQAADLSQSRKLIRDLATWVQCFTIYSSVIHTKFPEQVPALLGYMATKSVSYYKWPSWILYDQQFRQEAAETGAINWTKIDGGIHAYCFNGQSKDLDPWCTKCNTLDHTNASCPTRRFPEAGTSGTKRAAAFASGPARKRPPPGSVREPCKKWNRPEGPNCNFGDCIYLHICQVCSKPDHPRSKCPNPKPITKTTGY